MSAVALLLAAAAVSQPAGADAASPTLPVRTADAAPNPFIQGPPSRGVDIVSGGNVALEVDPDKSELTLGYSWARRASQLDGAGLRLARDVFHLELSLPVGGGDNLLDRETFDGLADGPSISVSWTWFGTRSEDRFGSAAFGEVMADARRGCAADRSEANTLSVEQCAGYLPERRFAQRFSRRSEASINRILASPTYAAGIEGSIGLNRYEYRTGPTLTEHADTEPQFSVKLFGTLFPADGMSMLTGSVEYTNSFEAQDDQILCRPVVINPNDDCATAAPGPPNNVETLQFAVEYRRVLGSIRHVGEFAIAPQARIDALSGEYELELPLYLAPENDFGISPGFSISYSSEDDEVTVGLFLKKTFSLG